MSNSHYLTNRITN